MKLSKKEYIKDLRFKNIELIDDLAAYSKIETEKIVVRTQELDSVFLKFVAEVFYNGMLVRHINMAHSPGERIGY